MTSYNIVEVERAHPEMRWARFASYRANCIRDKIGAVIYSDKGRPLAAGWNGAPLGHPQCEAGACPRGRLTVEELPRESDYNSGPGRCIAIHAEARAIEKLAPAQLEGSTMFVTRRPCPQCWTLLYESGLKRVVWPDGEEMLWT